MNVAFFFSSFYLSVVFLKKKAFCTRNYLPSLVGFHSATVLSALSEVSMGSDPIGIQSSLVWEVWG